MRHQLKNASGVYDARLVRASLASVGAVTPDVVDIFSFSFITI